MTKMEDTIGKFPPTIVLKSNKETGKSLKGVVGKINTVNSGKHI